MPRDFYLLVNHEPVVCTDLTKWLAEYGQLTRIVGRDELSPYLVLTEFTGLNYNFFSDGPPLLFETMIFKGTTVIHDASGPERVVPLTTGYQERCTTWLEAEALHARALAQIQLWLKQPENTATAALPTAVADRHVNGAP